MENGNCKSLILTVHDNDVNTVSYDEQFFWKEFAVGDLISLQISNTCDIPKIFECYHVITDDKYRNQDQHFQIGLYSKNKKYEYTYYTTESEYAELVNNASLCDLYKISIMPIRELTNKEIEDKFYNL
ncbi:HT motif gene family protein [Fowlpox virus]|nr:HT motif gene family protein [Fowlpox virus]